MVCGEEMCGMCMLWGACARYEFTVYMFVRVCVGLCMCVSIYAYS